MTVASALTQPYPWIEVVVVGNASTDTTWDVLQELARQDARLRIFRNDNIGPVRNWIACAQLARGTFAKILWSDDLIDPSFVSSTLPLFQDDVGFVYSGAKIFSSAHVWATYYMRGATGGCPLHEFIAAALHGSNVPYSPGCAIFCTIDLRRFLVAEVPNRMGSDFFQHAIGNDPLLLLTVAHRYPKVGFVHRALSSFRDHPGSISTSGAPGKLSLHYGMVKGYFAQSSGLDTVILNMLNAALQIDLWRYRKNTLGFRTHAARLLSRRPCRRREPHPGAGPHARRRASPSSPPPVARGLGL